MNWAVSTLAPLSRSQLREEDHLANARPVREQHDQSVDAEPQPARWRHTMLHRLHEIEVHCLPLVVADRATAGLSFQPPQLLDGVIQLRERVDQLHAGHVGLEALYLVR